MDVTAFAPLPSPGPAQPGDLYVDLQTRALWLGVDESVDPAGAVLISDIEALLANDESILTQANAYTDLAITSRAPLASPSFTGQPQSPTPPPGNNTDRLATTAFVQTAIANAAAADSMVGMIMIWPGLLTAVGTGLLADWAVCDGRSLIRAIYPELFAALNNGSIYGTADSTHFYIPDFRDRYPIGAGNSATGVKNTSANFVTDTQGGHMHTNTPVALTLAQLPSHSHTDGSLVASGTTGADGDHGHPTRVAAINQGSAQTTSTGGFLLLNSGQATYTAHTGAPSDTAGDQIGLSATHTHTVSVNVTGSTGTAGSGSTHTHGMDTQGGHFHTITPAMVKTATPYLYQAYIIKLR